MNARPQTSLATDDRHGSAIAHNAEHDYILMADLLQDMANADEGYDGSDEPVRDPETMELLSQLLIVLTMTTFCLGAQGAWRILERWSRRPLIPSIRTIENTRWHCILTSKC